MSDKFQNLKIPWFNSEIQTLNVAWIVLISWKYYQNTDNICDFEFAMSIISGQGVYCFGISDLYRLQLKQSFLLTWEMYFLYYEIHSEQVWGD